MKTTCQLIDELEKEISALRDGHPELFNERAYAERKLREGADNLAAAMQQLSISYAQLHEPFAQLTQELASEHARRQAGWLRRACRRAGIYL